MTWLARVATVASLSAGFARAIAFLLAGGRALDGSAWSTIAAPIVLLDRRSTSSASRPARAPTWSWSIGKLMPLAIFIVRRPVRRLVVDRVGTEADCAKAASPRPRSSSCSPTPASRTRRRRPASTSDRGATCRSRCWRTSPSSRSSTSACSGSRSARCRTWAPRPRRSPTRRRRSSAAVGGPLLTVGAAVSILGTVGDRPPSAGPRYLYALAHDGFGPRFLAAVHPRFRTPANAIVFQGAARSAARALGLVRAARRAVGDRATGDLLRHRGRGADPAPPQRPAAAPASACRAEPTIPIARLPGARSASPPAPAPAT